MFDVTKIREDFPILHQSVHGHLLVYLDNAATTQKPRAVIDRLVRYYETENANIHRGVYALSQRATSAYEEAREKVARFLNAPRTGEIIFTRGTTEGINLVASSFGRRFLNPGDEIILSALEHHSNIVPWQLVAGQTGAVIRVIPINDAGELMLDEYRGLLSSKTKIVSIVHVSNSLGTVNDVKLISQLAHEVGAKVLVDGAQWVAHHPTDVQALDCDFYAFSSHKLPRPHRHWARCGAAQELLDQMPPYQGGGDMIESVTFEKTIYADLPNKFEAGTPDIAGVIGLGAAVDYIQSLGFANFEPHEARLLERATRAAQRHPRRPIDRHRPKERRRRFLRHRRPGHRVPRRRHAPRPHGHRRPHRPPLLPAGHAAHGRTRHHPRIFCPLQHARRSRISRHRRPPNRRRRTRQTIEEARQANRIAIKGLSTLKFPEPAAPSPQAAADELIDLFQMLDDWSDRYDYIISMGEKLPPMPIELKTEDNRVRGCQSTVHLFARRRPGPARCHRLHRRQRRRHCPRPHRHP